MSKLSFIITEETLCHYCKKKLIPRLETSADIVVSYLWGEFRTYHYDCFKDLIEEVAPSED